MPNNEIIDRIDAIADHYGYEHQRMKLIEELGELIQALAKGEEQAIMWECADVTIMIQQVLYLLRLNTHIAIEAKVSRQEQRIKDEQNG